MGSTRCSEDPCFPDGMPQPAAGPDSRPFWQGCDEHRLLVQRCAECGTHRSPPKPICSTCGAFACTWSESNGCGRLFSYTIVHHTPHPVARQSVPYVIGVIELEDCGGVLLISNIVACPAQDLRVGLPVEVCWEDRSDGQTLHRFQPRPEPASGG